MFASKTAKTNSHSPPSGTNNLFVQPTLKTGTPGDKYEVEADRVADQVVANVKDSQISNDSFFTPTNSIQQKPFFGANAPVIQQSVEEDELKLSAKEDEGIPQGKNDLSTDESGDNLVQTELNTIQAKIETQTENEELQEKEEEEEAVQTKSFIQKIEDEQAPEEELQLVQAKSDSGGNSTSIESDLNNSSGGSSSMSDSTKSEMESGFGTDFSNVNIHTDSNAVQMSENIGAQAFTHGNDIYFNEGKYNPESDSGKHLLAHELTHTVQQGASVQPKMIQKVDGEGTENPDDILKKFYLPAVKARHLSIYQSWASQGKLKRFQGYARGNPNQVRLWKNHYWEVMQNTERIGLHENFSGLKRVRTPGDQEFRGRRRTLLKKLSVPNWDNQGVLQDHALEVDHIVELQAGGWPNSTSPNEIENMELLDKRSNASAGSKTKSNIVKIVRNYLEARGDSASQSDAESYMASNTVNFEQVELGQGDEFGGATIQSKFWSGAEIEQGVHLAYVEDLGNIGEPGTPTEFALMTPDDGFLMQLFAHAENVLSIPIAEDSPGSKAISGLSISNISLNTGYDALAADTVIGNITATWNLPDKFNAPEGSFSVSIKKSIGQYAGKIQNLPRIGLDFQDMSPINITGDYGINEDGVFAEGRLTPSMAFLQGATIVVGIRGEEVYFNAEYSPSNLNLPIPGLTIDSSTLWVGYSTVDGFGVGGNIEFQLASIGTGTIEGGYTQEEGFYIRGDITFDESLFGRTQASARMAYENSLWSIGGTLVIPENQVQGIKQATIIADYSEESGFTATGEAELDIPGIERGTMTVNYGDEGFSISGNFDLSSDIPGIRSGNVEARVAKEEGAENYDVMVSGTAEPDIPGIDSSLTVTYENGAITIEGRASYERGMLSGNVNIGATNRTIGEDGEPTGEPDDTMRVYGGGDLTLQLTPWLEATAGVQFLPNGEIEVTGRIALPSTVDVFDRKEFRRSLFTVPTIEIPIFAIPLGPRSIGLVAQISGGLDFSAGFGPGQLREVSAEVTYNPDREDETQITGHGEFAIPADAGLTLRGDLGLGVSVAIASLSGGIELAGTLGLEGEALASVDLSWSPQTGITLDAEGSITVNPKFTFDVNAFARASLGIGWFSISETWRHNLVSFSWGPDIQFGIVFPVHYQEDQPFDISFDDIEVIYPDLDVIDMAKDLAGDIKDDIFD